MSTYTKISDFAAKDALLTGNPSKIVKGTEIGAEFDSIASADASNVKGPTVAVTDNAVVRWDTTTGRLSQGSMVTIDDTGNIAATSITAAHNGTVGATTPATGAFTTLSASGGTSTDGLTVNGASGAVSGSGLEIGGGATPGILSYNRTSPGYLGLDLRASTISIKPNDSTVGVFSSTGLAVTGALSATFTGSSNNTFTLGQTTSSTEFQSNGQDFYLNNLGTGSTVFRMGTGRTEVARLDTSGNLGLGVTPSAWSGAKAYEFGGGNYVSSNGGNGIYIGNNNYYNGTNWIYKATAQASRYDQVLGQHVWYQATSGTAGTAITFTQAMTLDASGNLLVGQTATGYQDMLSVAVQGPSGYVICNHITGTTTGAVFAGFGYAGAGIGSITQNGTTAVAFNTTSDHRLKLNVRDANAARFMDIQFRDFEWVDGRHDCGVIAHELQAVYPDLVLGAKDATEVRTVEITPAVPEVLDADGNVVTPAVAAVTEQQTFPVYQHVNYIGLIGRMGTRIQQQQRLIDAQAAALAAIEARLTAAGL